MPDNQSKKLKLLEWFYCNPLSSFMKDGIIKAVIHGAHDEDVIEALKAAYHLGQTAYIAEDETLHYADLKIILYLNRNPSDGWSELHSAMPGLMRFPYADISIRNAADWTKGEWKDCCVLDCDVLFSEKCQIPSDKQDELYRLNLNQKYANDLAKGRCVSYSDAKKKRDREKDNDPYRFESSLACTAHMPARLSLFNGNESEQKAQIQELMNLPAEDREKDVRYRALAVLEHRRWNAYMIADGYTQPTKEEFLECAYKVWPDQKDTIGKKHPCICDGGDDPFYLKNHSEAWNDAEFETNEHLSELDKFSIRCHRLCCIRSRENEADIRKKKDELAAINLTLKRFAIIASRYINDPEYNDDYLYKQCLTDARDAEDGKYKVAVDELDQLLRVYKARNAKKDYARLDVDMIDAIPFDFWHGKIFSKVLIPCNGNLVTEISLPFLLSSSHNIFLLDENAPNSQETERRIQRFFEDRSILGQTEFHKVDFNNSLDVMLLLNHYAASEEEVVLSASSALPPSLYLAYGKILENNPNASLFSVHKDDVQNVLFNQSITCGVKKGITAKEYLSLMSSEYENVFVAQPVYEEYEALRNIFIKHAHVYRLQKRRCSTWGAMDSFFSGASKFSQPEEFFGREIYAAAEADDEEQNSTSTKRVDKLTVNKEVFQYFKIDDLLKELCTNRIIGNVELDLESDSVNNVISFFSPDLSVRMIFRCVGKLKTVPKNGKRIHFSNGHARIQLMDTCWPKELEFFDANENEKLKKNKTKLVKELRDNSLITCKLDERNGICYDLEFSRLRIKYLFQTPGRVFEAIMFRQIRELGFFDNVQTGVKIEWDELGKWDMQSQLHKLLNEEPDEYGLAFFRRKQDEARKEAGPYSENEIDVVMMLQMHAFFLSCKTGTRLLNEWIYEIDAVSAHFLASPILAVSFDLEDQKESCNRLLARAQGMGVSLLGAETIFDSDKFRKCMKTIADGGVYSILDEGN